MTTPDTVGFASAARHYIAAGWSGVLPLSRGTKHPPPVGYTGRGGVWPDADTVERWAVDNPGGNIALRMPGYVIGIDVDHYGDKVGGDTLEALEQARGPLPATWTSTSRGPGSSGIRFYRVPEGVELPGVLGPCIEAIQFHHRYAVVAPSVVDGRRYRWYAPDGTVAKRPPAVDELAELPATWLDGWSTPREPITLERLSTSPAPSTIDRSRAVQRALDDGLRHMRQPGSRHDMARDHCLALVRLLDAGHPGADEALEQLGWTFRLAISDRTAPRQAEQEWQSMVDGAWDIVRSTPSTRPRWDELDRTPVASSARPAPPPNIDPETGEVITPEEAAHRLRAHLYLGDAIFGLPPVEWLVEGVVQRSGLTVTYGAPKSYKTFVVLDMWMHVANGLPWRGHATQQAKVLYIAAEGAPGVGPRAQAWASRYDGNLDNMAWITVAADLYSIDKVDADLLELAAIIEDHAIDQVIVDTLARSMAGADENSGRDMGAVLGNVGWLMERTGCGVNLVHHTGKDTARGMRGHSSLQGAVDTSLEVIGDPHAVNCHVVDQKNAESGQSWWWKPRIVAPSLVLEPSDSVAGTDEAIDLTILRQLWELGGDSPMSRWEEAVTELGACGSTKFHKRVPQLETQGLVAKGAGKRGTWHLTPEGLQSMERGRL